MPDTQPPASPDAPVALPTDTTPTWEIELLISGALAFASWQIPGFFDQWFAAWRPRLVPEATEFLVLVFLLGKAVGLVLAATFALHILLRGLWAAALGLHSVYPSGIDWDGLKSGPYFRAESQRTVMPLPRFIARLDNAASIIFATGGLLLMLALLSTVVPILTYVVAAAWTRITGRSAPTFAVLGALTLLFAGPATVGGLVDRVYGPRWAPDSVGAKRLQALARYASSSSLSRLMGPMLLVFTSRAGQRRGMLWLLGAFYLAMGVVLAQVAMDAGDLKVEGYRYLADDGEEVVLPVHYADQRSGRLTWSARPFLPSEVLTGGLVRVFVPWRIGTHDRVVARTCGAVGDTARTSTDTVAQRRARRAVAACLGAALDPRLDGAPVTTEWSMGMDGASELRGLVTHLNARGLADGRHVLSFAWHPNPKSGDTTVVREEIPFWLDRSGRDP